jgi:uncharacterized protein Usg
VSSRKIAVRNNGGKVISLRIFERFPDVKAYTLRILGKNYNIPKTFPQSKLLIRFMQNKICRDFLIRGWKNSSINKKSADEILSVEIFHQSIVISDFLFNHKRLRYSSQAVLKGAKIIAGSRHGHVEIDVISARLYIHFAVVKQRAVCIENAYDGVSASCSNKLNGKFSGIWIWVQVHRGKGFFGIGSNSRIFFEYCR